MVYVFNFRDLAGAQIAHQEERCPSDVRAVVRAVQMMRDEPACASVEVLTAKDRLVRRLARSELG